MENIKQKLIERAIERHSKIFPCGNRNTLSECFTIHGETLVFWYNTEDNSTCVVYETLSNPK